MYYKQTKLAHKMQNTPFKRKIDSVFEAWKNKPQHLPIVVKGCRQCGKTYSVRKFAEEHYRYVVYLDFFKHPELKTIFDDSLDVDKLTRSITMSGVENAKFVTGETCLILDEIQDCPRARTSLKFFSIDGRYDVMCTGSLLGVNGYKTEPEQQIEDNAPIPVGYEQIINMCPMDFEEWLWANGFTDEHIDLLRQHLKEKTPVELAIHQRMRELIQQYTIVGGMPAAVRTFFETNDMQEVATIQHNIIADYQSDMVKYAPLVDRPRIRECFDSIPAQLSQEYKKFTYTSIRKNARGKDYVGSLQWIEDAGIIRRCYNTEITELPLDGNAIRSEFKVYMADTGLFVSMLEEGTAWSIARGELYTYKGAIFENLLADIFGKMGRKLYYYHKNGGIELDFLIRYYGECVPIECKAVNGNAKSMKTVLQNPDKYHVQQAIKIGDYNVGLSGNILTIPHYMVFLLTEM